MLLGRVPTTSSYRLIACSLGPEQRRTCEGLLPQLVGTAMRTDGLGGAAAIITQVSAIRTNRGERSVAVQLDQPGALVVTSSATLERRVATLTGAETTALRTRTRAISPRATWATGERFEVHAFDAELDGDDRPDRVAIGTTVDFGAGGERVIVAIAVGLAGRPFELVDWHADRVELLGTTDLDGDGRDEVLVTGTLPAGNFRYALMHVLPGKPLAMDPAKPGSFSAAWQPYDAVEERVHDEGPALEAP